MNDSTTVSDVFCFRQLGIINLLSSDISTRPRFFRKGLADRKIMHQMRGNTENTKEEKKSVLGFHHCRTQITDIKESCYIDMVHICLRVSELLTKMAVFKFRLSLLSRSSCSE